MAKRKNEWGKADLMQWYISLVDASEPIWTEAHIDELLKDFIVIKKDNQEEI